MMRQVRVARGNVLALWRYQVIRRAPILDEVLTYWEELRAGRVAPLRSEVDPRGIEGALEGAFILEKVGPGIIRFRVAGMVLNDLMGMEVRGMPGIALFEAEDRDRVEELLDGVFAQPQMLCMSLASRLPGRSVLTAQMLVLPLRDDDGALNRALGCLATEGLAGPTPRRFTLEKASIEQIKSAATATPGQHHRIAGFAEPGADYQPPKLRTFDGGCKNSRSKTRPPVLRVISGDETPRN